MGLLRRSSLALLAALLLALAFPPLERSWLAFVGLIPLLLALRGVAPRRAFFLGWLAGFAFFSLVVWWITVAVINFGGLPFIVGWALLFLLTAFLGLWWGLFALLARLAWERDWLGDARGLLFLAAGWTGLEWLRGNLGFLAFPWANIAYTQYRNPAFIQSAGLAGPYGPGFVLVAANIGLLALARILHTSSTAATQSRSSGGFPSVGLLDVGLTTPAQPSVGKTAIQAPLNRLATNRREVCGLVMAVRAAPGRRRSLARSFLLALLLTAASLSYGAFRLARLDAAPHGREISVAVIQGNIAQEVKWAPDFREKTFAAYLELTRAAAAAGAELIVWPEAAVPFYYQDHPEYQRLLAAAMREARTPLLFGAPAYVPRDGGPALRNRVYLMDEQGEIAGSYDKMHLVPFGEYVPLKKLFFFAGKLVQEVGDFTPGDFFTLFPVAGSQVGAVICYEIIFPDLVRRFPLRGANLMVTVTNDAWYGPTSASLQHFSQMVFRAVENGVPIARAANTGISGFVDAGGRILEASELFVRGFWVRGLQPGTERTLYTRVGDVFPWGCLALVAVTLLVVVIRRNPGTPIS